MVARPQSRVALALAGLLALLPAPIAAAAQPATDEYVLEVPQTAGDPDPEPGPSLAPGVGAEPGGASAGVTGAERGVIGDGDGSGGPAGTIAALRPAGWMLAVALPLALVAALQSRRRTGRPARDPR